MSIRHPLGRADVNLTQLCAELRARLGRPVEIVARAAAPGDPGVLICEDRDTGEWLDIDPELIAEVVAAHTPPVRPLSTEERALRAFDAASSDGERLAAIRRYLSDVVAAQAAARRRFAVTSGTPT